MVNDLAHGLESLGRVFSQETAEQVAKVCIFKPLQIWLFVQNSLHSFHLVTGRVHERRQANHHFIQKTAEGPKVTLLVELLSLEELRRQIFEGAEKLGPRGCLEALRLTIG